MSNRARLGAALCCVLATSLAAPAFADGEILLTHAKALAGNVTPGDAAGYPITISIPGSFQLASNLFVAADKIGIQVTHDNVTIDLNGFLMEGSGFAWYGIAGGVDGVTIRNGTIANFEFDGLKGTGKYWIIEGMRVLENGRDGVFATGENWTVEDVRAVGNGRYGIYVRGLDSAVRDSTVTQNEDAGIICGGRCLVEGSNASGNGSLGISIDYGAALGNVMISNFGVGLAGGSLTGFANNTMAYNNGGGVQVGGTVALHPNACLPACP